MQPSATTLRLSMTDHGQSTRAGVPARPRCVSRRGQVAVSRPRSRVRRSERDATCLSVARVLCGVEWQTPTIELSLASGPAPRADSERVSPTRRAGVQAPSSASASARAGRGSRLASIPSSWTSRRKTPGRRPVLGSPPARPPLAGRQGAGRRPGVGGDATRCRSVPVPVVESSASGRRPTPARRSVG